MGVTKCLFFQRKKEVQRDLLSLALRCVLGMITSFVCVIIQLMASVLPEGRHHALLASAGPGRPEVPEIN